MATVADIVTGILVTELAADDDMTMLAMTDSRNLLIQRYLQQRQKQKKRVLQMMAHICIRRKRALNAAGGAGNRRPRRKRKDKEDNNCDHDYLNDTIPWFCDDEFTEFRNHFKIERATFDKIVAYSAPKLGHQDKCTLPVERKILVAMWLLSSQESFRTIGEKFGLQKSTTYYAFVQFVCAVGGAAREFIFWPDTPSLALIAAEYERHYCLPGVVGAVHSCQIPVKIARSDQAANEQLSDAGLSAEPYSTMTLQAVCDSRLKLLDVHVGVPQPTNAVVCNWRFLEASDVGQELHAGEGAREVPAGYHVLADSSYPLRPYLLTPYQSDVVDRSDAARNFNAAHQAAHHTVHRCLGLLRRRFSRLKYVDTLREDLVPQIVMAACVLHNMIVEDENEASGDDSVIEHDFSDEEHGRACAVLEHHLDDEQSLARRDEIANQMLI